MTQYLPEQLYPSIPKLAEEMEGDIEVGEEPSEEKESHSDPITCEFGFIDLSHEPPDGLLPVKIQSFGWYRMGRYLVKSSTNLDQHISI